MRAHPITLVAAVAALAGLAVGGCGGGSPEAAALHGAIDRYVQGMRTRNPTETCAAITPAYYRAVVQTIAEEVGGGARPAPGASCTTTLHVLFDAARGLGARPGKVPAVTLTDVAVHGDTATATGVHGASREPFRFLRSDGTWRVDCCVGAQLDHQPSVTYRVPSTSMEPTFHVGQIVVSDNRAFRTRAPAIGDVVVLHPPAGADSPTAPCGDPHEGGGFPRPCGVPTAAESTQTFLKRIVGLPGDRISISHGIVIRNGVSEGSAHTNPCGTPAFCDFPTSIVIPAGEYYVMGDNRGVSDDSRFWGPVKRAWIIGLITHS